MSASPFDIRSKGDSEATTKAVAKHRLPHSLSSEFYGHAVCKMGPVVSEEAEAIN